MSLRAFACAAALLTAVTACSGDDADPASGATGADGSGEQIEVTHDLGTLALDGEVTRVVTTSDETTELVVALGLQPVGIASTRIDTTSASPLEGYYLPADRLGEPEIVGGEEVDVEQVAVLEPDLVVHGSEDGQVDALSGVAPTVVFDVQAPGAWERALAELGEATGRAEQAESVTGDYAAAVAAAREELAPVASRYPRIGVIYPQYRGGADNYLFDEDFALASVIPQLGFELAGSDRAEEAFPGVQQISAEAYSSIQADLLLALGTEPWQETTSAPVLEVLPVPVLGVALDDGQPSTGPITSPALLERYVAALQAAA